MSYLALARKWRPRRFSELVGQEHVVRALTHALESGRLHHALLFTGTRGVGKTTIARIFAKSLNCEKGPTSEPCGECSACVDIDAGRFVDLLEIDAASNTGIDNVRELIDNAMYAPTRGRYKVYLIDEVHMLSKGAFNALLKTLEEPPPHVKFLLATTDPQKMLVTVLSRCIKFNLKRLTPEQITGQMRHILAAEGITFDEEGIEILARAADGSLRDGLSLLDQAIAHGGGSLEAREVHAMLGTVERAKVRLLLERIADGDGPGLLEEAERTASYAPDFAQVLDEVAGLLHRLQLMQLVPAAATTADAELLPLAARVGAEDIQLWYQMAVTGRRDLPLAPTPQVGFEMALLRMLAFAPAAAGMSAATPSASAPAVTHTNAPPASAPMARRADLPPRQDPVSQPAASAPPRSASPAPAPYDTPATAAPAPVREPAPAASAPFTGHGNESWGELIERAELGGPVGQLARHATLVGIEDGLVRLALKPTHQHLAMGPMVEMLEQRLSVALGREVKVRFERDNGGAESPAEQRERADRQRQQAAESAVRGDPVVQSLVDTFDARVVPGSVRPAD